MNQVTSFDNNQTISSLELRNIINAARTEFGEAKVRNDQFLARVEDELSGELGVCKIFAHPQSGVEMRYYDLARDQCALVGMRESKGVRRNVLAKLKEMEAQQQPKLPSNYIEALENLVESEKARQVAMEQLEAAKPAVEFVGRYVESTSLKGFRQVAKLLNTNERELRQFFSDHKIMYQLGGEWMPYQSHIAAGRIVVKAGAADNGHAFNTAKFTPKGINWLAGLLQRQEVAV